MPETMIRRKCIGPFWEKRKVNSLQIIYKGGGSKMALKDK